MTGHQQQLSEIREESASGTAFFNGVRLAALNIRVEWVVEEMIPQAELTIFTGDPKIGKSRFMLYLANQVARERNVLNLMVKKDGPVLLANFEDGPVLLSQRLHRMSASDRFDILDAAAFDAQVSKRVDREGISELSTRDKIRERSKILAQLLTNLVAERKYVLLILDPAIESLQIEDENSASQVASALAPLRTLARDTGVAVVLVHHNNKAGGYRGSSAFLGSPGTLITMRKEKEKNLYRLAITSRSSDSASEPIYMRDADSGTFGLASAALRNKAESSSLTIADHIVELLNVKGGEIRTNAIRSALEKAGVSRGTSYPSIMRHIDGDDRLDNKSKRGSVKLVAF